jgi:hypothetical protein
MEGTTKPTTHTDLAPTQRIALLIGAAGIAASVLGFVLDRQQFAQSYLVAYLFWFCLGIGCLPWLLLHHLAGGRWGFIVRRFLEAGVRTLPLLALFFVPLLFVLPDLYLWARPDAVAHDPVLQHKSLYLNVPFFIGRAAVYFLVWIAVGFLACRWATAQETSRQPTHVGRLRGLGGVGLGLYALAATFSAIDWGMSLDPHWFSTVYGLLLATGQVLAALALVIITLAALAGRDEIKAVIAPQQVNDLGNFLLTFIMMWAYLAFSQFLIIWSGNIREEAAWYVHRMGHGWQTLAILLLVLHFAVPFLLLLSPRLKTNLPHLARLAGWVLLMRAVDLYWNIIPTFSSHGIPLHWLDATAWLGLGGIWVAVYLRALRRHSLVPGFDPRVHQEKPNE